MRIDRDRHHPRPENQSGQLLVSGKNYVEIKLDGSPVRIVVKFRHKHHHPHPCNPGPEDELSYSTVTNNDKTFLFINWNVSGIEEVIWKAYYSFDDDDFDRLYED